MRTSAPTIISTEPGNSLEVPQKVYRCPNVKLEGYNVFTNKPEGGQMRCVGHSGRDVSQEVHMTDWRRNSGWIPSPFR